MVVWVTAPKSMPRLAASLPMAASSRSKNFVRSALVAMSRREAVVRPVLASAAVKAACESA